MLSKRRQFIDKKLIRKLRIFFVVCLLMISLGTYDVAIGYVNWMLAVAALVGGFALGLLVGRTVNIVWHEEAGKAVRKMDRIGIIILIAYLVFAIFRRTIFSHWLTGHKLSAFAICFSAGIMTGRLLTLRRQIKKVLKQQGL